MTSFLRKSMRKARVAKLRRGSAATTFFSSYRLSGAFWSSMSSMKRGKEMTGSLRLLKNFLIRLAIRCGLVMLSKYS
jgi:predicted DNA-binding ribbon-helix-helix protein